MIDCPVGFLDSLIARAALERLQQPDAIEALFPASEIGNDPEFLESQVAEINSKIKQFMARRAAAINELESLADHPGLSARTVARSIESFDDKITKLKRAAAEMMEQMALGRQRILLERHKGMLEDGWENRLTFWDRRTVIDALMTVVIERTSWGKAAIEHFSKDDVLVEWKRD